MVTIELLFQTFSAYNSDIYIPDTAKPIFNVYPTSYSPMKHFNVTSQRIFLRNYQYAHIWSCRYYSTIIWDIYRIKNYY